MWLSFPPLVWRRGTDPLQRYPFNVKYVNTDNALFVCLLGPLSPNKQTNKALSVFLAYMCFHFSTACGHQPPSQWLGLPGAIGIYSLTYIFDIWLHNYSFSVVNLTLNSRSSHRLLTQTKAGSCQKEIVHDAPPLKCRWHWCLLPVPQLIYPKRQAGAK